MKKCYSIVFIIFLALRSFAQAPQADSRKFIKVSGIYGTKFLQNTYYQNQLNSTQHFKLNAPLSFVGLSLDIINHWYIGNSLSYEQSVSYLQLLPSNIKINDSLSADLTGFQAGVGLFGNTFVLKKNRSYLHLILGFNAGRLKLNSTNFLQTNSFFSPKITLKPSFRLSKLYLDLAIAYEYDLSKQNWKNQKSSTDQKKLNKLSQTGLSAFVSLGFYIF